MTEKKKNINLTKKGIAVIVGVIIFVLVICPLITSMIVNNHAITLEENCETSTADINSQLTRRAQLIPDIVSTIKHAGAYEHDTQLDVIEQRASNDTGGEYNATLEIQAVAEAYPELKNNENYQSLILELSTTENLLFTYRAYYNEQVRDYNKFVRQQPWATILNMTGYERQAFTYTEDLSNGVYSSPGALFDE